MLPDTNEEQSRWPIPPIHTLSLPHLNGRQHESALPFDMCSYIVGLPGHPSPAPSAHPHPPHPKIANLSPHWPTAVQLPASYKGKSIQIFSGK